MVQLQKILIHHNNYIKKKYTFDTKDGLMEDIKKMQKLS